MGKAQIILEIVTLLQGTPVDAFARHNLAADGNRVVVRCAEAASADTPAGQLCKRAIATALRRYSHRFTMTQLTVLVDLYATALEQLEPAAAARVRDHMCDPGSEDALRDPPTAAAVCERLSMHH